MKTKNWPFILIIFTICQLFTINIFPDNFEFTFSEGSKFFETFEKKYIDFFFKNQANTFFFSFIIGVFDKLTFGTIDNLILARFLSLCSYGFLYFGILNTLKYFKIHKSLHEITIIFIIFNPIIWTLSFRGSPDLFSASLGFYASSFFLVGFNNSLKRNLSIFLLSISIVLKPISAIFVLYIFLIIKKKSKLSKFEIFTNVILFLLIPIIYFLTIKKNFGFFVMSDNFYLKHSTRIDFEFIIKNLIGYACFLAIFSFPANFSFKINYKFVFLYLFIMLVGILNFNFFNYKLGELDFGFFNNYFNNYILLIITYSILFSLIIKIYEIFKNKKKNNVKILITIAIFLLILSSSKPVQRYLIFILPLLILLIIQNTQTNKIRKLLIVGIIIFIPINFISLFHKLRSSDFHYTIFEYIKANDMEKVIQLKKLRHALGFIEINDFDYNNKIYLLTDKSDEYVKKFEKHFLGKKKSYYIEKIN